MSDAVALALDVIASVAARLRGRDRALVERSIRVIGQALSSAGQQVDSRWTAQVDSAGGQLLDAPLSSLSLSESFPAATEEKSNPEKRAERVARATGQRVDRALDGALDSVGGQREVDRAGGQHARNAALAGCWDGVGGVSTSGSQRARIGEARPLLERLARERDTDPVKLFQAACDRFKSDAGLKVKRMCTLPVLLSQLEQWVDDPPSADGKAAPSATEREWDAACAAGDAAMAKMPPGTSWDAPELAQHRERIAKAKRALDAQRNRQEPS